METIKNAIEVSQEEFDSRTLSRFGYYSSVIDVLLVVLYFAAMGAIVAYVIPQNPGQGSVYFWQIILTILFIQAFKGISRITNALSAYQTIIIRK